MDINGTFRHRAKVYFTCIKSLKWAITVPNMNKINPFFLYIFQQTKCKKNSAIITCFSTTWYVINGPNINKVNPFFYEISQQIHKM